MMHGASAISEDFRWKERINFYSFLGSYCSSFNVVNIVNFGIQ